MTDQRQYDSAALRDHGKHLMRIGDDSQAAWARLKRKSEGMGDIFGDDLVGGLIGAAYGAIYALADGSFTSASNDLVLFGEKLKYVGDTNEQVEDVHVTMLSDIGTSVDQAGVEV
ncbi:hypothetical protein [Actinopolymorpha pittospori]